MRGAKIKPSLTPITASDPIASSDDLVAANIERLKAMFPELVTECADGVAVNVDVLKSLVGDATVTDADEKYGLNWHGKRAARRLALTPSTGTLRPCPEESVDWDTTQNLMIEGDNLEVLKLLQKSHTGKVKLIYIDPPYNTGKDFVYPDDYRDNIQNYLELTGQVEGGRKISSNTEASGRFHTDWLNMMYPRLSLARQLLKPDGAIFISIDDNEVTHIRAICNEVLGEENFVAQIVWEKGRKNDATLFSLGHDYIVVYARSKAHLSQMGVRWREAMPGADAIQSEYLRLVARFDDDTRSIEKGIREFYANLPKDHPAKRLSRYGNVDDRGVWRDDNMSWPGGGGPRYDVIHPRTGVACKVPEGGWRYATPERMNQMIKSGRVAFREDHTEPPIRKTYLVRVDDGEESDDVIDAESDETGIQVAGTYFYRSALQASNTMLRLFGSKVFDSPKDHEVLARWIRYVSHPLKDEVILDFFAGSGSTGHAVMEQNAADGGNRRYILVQLPEPILPADRAQKVALDLCDRIGVARNIAELTKERLRRAGGAIAQRSGEQSLDLGFRVFKLDSSNIRTWDPDRDNLDQTLLDAVEHIKPGRTETDVLYELLLKLGLDLCVPIETRTIAGSPVHAVGGGVLIACLSEKIKPKSVEALALGIVEWHGELAPAGETTCVFRDSAFADDVSKTNMAAILGQHGLRTVRSL
jgi:adenine-specific DNA-methyltransferase